MVFNSLIQRLGLKHEKEPQTRAQPIPSTEPGGRIELVGDRLVVHDPAGEGRFPSLLAEGGVRLLVNGAAVNGLAVVSSADDVRWVSDQEPHAFCDITVSEDGMAASLTVTTDPFHLPDIVTLEGQHPARVRPAYSPNAPQRPRHPRDVVLDRLAAMGIRYGVDEVDIDSALAAGPGTTQVIARGQEAQPAVPGEWLWRLDDWGLVEPGQVIAIHKPEQPGMPRITVLGEETVVFDLTPESPAFAEGEGTRLLAGGRLVAVSSGRARIVQGPHGVRVEVVPVHIAEKDLTGELTFQGDVLVKGNVTGARLTTTGEILIAGNVERSHLVASAIKVRGGVTQSQLFTAPKGHFAPLRAELAFVQRRLADVADAAGTTNPAVREQALRELGLFVRALRRKGEELHVDHAEFRTVMDDLNDSLVRSDVAESLSRNTVNLLLTRLGQVMEAAGQSLAGDVRVGALAQSTVWAGRDCFVEQNFAGSAIYCGGSLQTPASATGIQSEIVAGGDVRVGKLMAQRGANGVMLRARRIEAEEITAGCAAEFGAELYEFRTDLVGVVIGINGRGRIVIKQREQ